MKFINYPVKPYKLNQGFGVNPDYYAKFGWNGHNGLDLFAPHATPLFAPCDGDAFYAEDAHGGAGIYIRYPNNQKPEYDIILWHLCTKTDPVYHPRIPMDGSVISVKTGAFIGYTDNSGAPYESSGDHLHLGLLPTDSTAAPLDKNNGYGGCVDPSPYLTGLFAEDVPSIDQVVETSEKVVQAITQAPISNQEKSDFLSKVEAIIKIISSFFIK